jgi:hypothetical protein
MLRSSCREINTFAVFLIACVIILWFVYTLLLGKVVVKVTKNNVPN